MKTNKKVNWIKQGFTWALLMFLSTAVLVPLIQGKDLSISNILLAIPVWTIFGLVLGYSMRYVEAKKGASSNEA